jgi:hypothetical protein
MNELCKFIPLILIIFATCGITSFAKAEIYELYRGARGLGMGGADTAVVNDETSLLINPAGLGKLRNNIGVLFDPEVEIGDNVYEMYRAKAFTGFTDLDKLNATLDTSRDTHYHYKYQFFPSFVLKNFGMGMLVKESMDARMSADGATITAAYFYDWVLATGFNFRFWDGRIKLGVTAKAINRVQAVGDFPVAQSLKIQDIGKEGYGLGSDVGLILSAPWGWIPTLSVVGRDIGGTQFTNTGLRYKLTNKPDELKQDADVALAFFPIHDNRTRSSFTFEHKHVLTASTYTNKTQLYHFGWETNVADIAFFRFGLNGQYYSLGFEMASERMQFQVAYFADEVGTDTAAEDDRRWNMKIAVRF